MIIKNHDGYTIDMMCPKCGHEFNRTIGSTMTCPECRKYESNLKMVKKARKAGFDVSLINQDRVILKQTISIKTLRNRVNLRRYNANKQ